VYVTGQSQCAGSGSIDYVTIKYRPMVPCAEVDPPLAVSLRPVDGSTGANDLVLSWNTVQGADAYQVQCDTTLAQDFADSLLWKDTTVTEDHVMIQGVYGLLYWRVRSLTDCDTSAWTTPLRYTDVADSPNSPVPRGYELFQNHPNPFNASTVIHFTLAAPTEWTLTIYNAIGQTVQTFHGTDAQGAMHIEWDGRNDRGEATPSGIYFYRLQTRDFTETKSMVLLK
jgi:hypothetical protein